MLSLSGIFFHETFKTLRNMPFAMKILSWSNRYRS